jgi:hypothetical protein
LTLKRVTLKRLILIRVNATSISPRLPSRVFKRVCCKYAHYGV